MKQAKHIDRAVRLSSLLLFSFLLSVATADNGFARQSDSPGSSTDQANLHRSVAYAQIDDGFAGGAASSGAQDVSQQLFVSNPSPKQGEPIRVSDLSGKASEISFNGNTFKLVPEQRDGAQITSALIAIPSLLKPGTYKIESAELSSTINVLDAHFGLQRLHLPKNKDNFKASPGERETMDKAKKTFSDTQEWQGVFRKPVKGARMSTRFGVRRIVNGKMLKDYFHSGLDFAAPTGTPITAVAPGTVIVAHNGWRLHGNVVCIDHGRGVISISIHMSKILVKEGDKVEAGQVIGAVGQTGRASGPHLHFGVYVNNEASNPDFWFSNKY